MDAIGEIYREKRYELDELIYVGPDWLSKDYDYRFCGTNFEFWNDNFLSTECTKI